jgi:SAM-dependent methyltransferase
MASFDLASTATRVALDLRETRLPLSRALARLQPDWHSDWAWENYERAVLALAREFGLKRLLEIGGGRDPAFAEAARANGLTLIVNDIDAGELARLPAGFETACFDVSGDLGRRPELVESFDFVASRMVFEHIHDVEAAWRNVHRILRPGGIGLAFFPTLYAWPFVLNWLLPNDLAKGIVERFYPARASEGDNPVFPPVYDWCFGSQERMGRMLDPIGFSEAQVVPFWGHHYLDRVPVARQLDNAFNRLAARLDWRLFTTYAYVVVRK